MLNTAATGREIQSSMSVRRCAAALFAILLQVSSWIYLQAEPLLPLVHGRILDSTRTPVAGAKVTATAEGQLQGVSAETDQTGQFQLSVPAGRYTLTIETPGFKSVSESILVPPSGFRDRELVLEVAPLEQVVNVIENSGYVTPATASATKTLTALRDVPQSLSIVSRDQMQDQLMTSIADVVRYVPGIQAHMGENNRDQVVIRGNTSSADFFVNGVRDDVEYLRDLYNLERVEALKGPNAMIFGRGGGGGVINRVTKDAGFTPLREVTLQGGSFGNKRFAADFNQPLGEKMAVRFNGVYENSDSFRRFVNLERYGVAPTFTWNPTERTRFLVAYERFVDERVADRGITSYRGLPADVPRSTFAGNPNDSYQFGRVHLGTVTAEHQRGVLNLRNRSVFGGYDRFYQNYVPGAPTPDRVQLAITAYNNATQRLNLFNQTDLSGVVNTWGIRHTLLGGAEFGRQITDNLRNTGFFNNTSLTVFAPFANPVISTPITWRPLATDAFNHVVSNIAAGYVQDQVRISRYVQLVAGLRWDRFENRLDNLRNGDRFRRVDHLTSPRAGLIVKPWDTVSLYASYSVSYLPSSGDQFAGLTNITAQLKPEKFSNYEAGLKWDATRNVAFTAAVYQLDRTNTRAVDPNDPTRILQTGSQQTRGAEVGINGNLTRKWRVSGGYAYQLAEVTSATAAARQGARVAQVPRNTFSFWNHYQVFSKLGAGLGLVNRADMFAGIDNTVVLPGFTRVDAAVFYSLTERVRVQANVENLTDRVYYSNAHTNTNIMPGMPRAVRLALIARF
jgi:catecholate siderophore receptor